MQKFVLAQWIRQLYDWTMRLAQHPRATVGLCFISLIESVIFPLPVDPLLFAMGAARPKKSLYYATLVTLFSVLGGLLGYALGYWFWSLIGEFFFAHIISEEKMKIVFERFNENDFLAIFLAGLTPIPYKVFTLSAGIAHISIPIFIVASICGRGLRFFLVGGLMYYFGPEVRRWLEKHLTIATIVLGVVVLAFFIVYKLAHQ